MGQKFAGISVALFAVIFIVVGAQDDCEEQKAGACVEKLLTAILGDISEEEACGELRFVSKCLRDVADECLGEERDPEINTSLEELDNLISQNCPAPERDDDDEVAKCVDENKEYLLECVIESMSEVDKLLGKPDEIDMNLMKCAFYGLMTECVVERTGEKCGAAGRKKATEEMADMPPSVREACSAQESLDFFTAQLLTRKKK